VVALRRVTLWVAITAASWYFGIRILGRVLPADSLLRQWPDSVWTLQVMASQSLYLWAVLLTLLGWAKVYLDRPFRWLPYCTEAVYPWYILHQSLIIALLFWLKPLQLGPWWEPTLVLAGTVAFCLLLHEGLMRRIGWLRPLFGLRRERLSPMRLSAGGAAAGSPGAG
jgi:hypothetical protein